jgi:hypothetical protein
VDVETGAFVVIRDTKKGKDVAYLAPVMNSEAKDMSALLIANEGDQRIVHSLRLRDLGEVFIYEPALVRGTGDVREAHPSRSWHWWRRRSSRRKQGLASSSDWGRCISQHSSCRPQAFAELKPAD